MIRQIVRLTLALLLLTTGARAAEKPARYPKNPFAGDHVPPKPSEVGTTAGQVRLSCNLGVQANKSPQLLMQCGGELMTWAWLGLRANALFSLRRFGHQGPHLFALRIGPSIHLLPYRRVDLSAFFEAGAQGIEPFSKTWMAVIAGGLTFTVSLSAYWFLQLEGQVSWGVYERSGAGHQHLGVNIFVGAGVQL